MSHEENHARQNASAWMDTVHEYVRALDSESWERLEELRDEKARLASQELEADEEPEEMDESDVQELAKLEAMAEEYQNEEHARQIVEESPLSVQVRSGWVSPGAEMEAEDFEILLSTGGPALRIRGELDQYNQPASATLEYQDWGTPWTEYYGENFDRDALLTYCQVFYFGD